MTRSVVIVHGGSELYGADVACLWIARAARASGWLVEVVIPRAGLLADALVAAGVPVHFIDPLVLRRADVRGPNAAGLPVQIARATNQLRRLARERSFDLVHTNGLPALGGAYLARRWHVPLVWGIHEILPESRALRRGLGSLLGRATVVTACSAAALHQFESPRVRQRGRVIYTGAEVPSGVATSIPLSGGPITVVCVGRLNDWKGQDVLIDALALLSPAHDVRLSIVGDVFQGQDHYRDKLESQIAALGLSARVRLEGERRDALELVARADIFVMPSRQPEPFGIALVEAMTLGRPVVATAAGGPLEILTDGDDGLLVPPGDATALAAAIDALIGDPDAARRMATRAVDRAARFSVRSMTDGVLAAYDDALATRAV